MPCAAPMEANLTSKKLIEWFPYTQSGHKLHMVYVVVLRRWFRCRSWVPCSAQAMAALGEERAFLADTTQKLDTSLEERKRLLAEVAEAKEKVLKYCWRSSIAQRGTQKHRQPALGWGEPQALISSPRGKQSTPLPTSSKI